VFDREDPFAAVIRCTADPEKADKRTRSKWSRLMRYAAAYKPDTEALRQFMEPTIFKAKPARKIIKARRVKAAKDAIM
jgi:hypothetical protein